MTTVQRLLLVVFSLIVDAAFCQSRTERITGEFSAIKFADFVHLVENQTAYKFYYDPVVLDSLLVTAAAYEETIGVL